MPRHKVKMAFIEHESTRKSTYKKRKKGLLKKAYELETLCGVPICVLIDSAFDSNPEVWPSREKANHVVSEWRKLSESEKSKKMVNQKTFLQQRISKTIEKYRKLWKENKELEMKNLMFDCLNGKTSVACIDKSHLKEVGCVIEQKLKDLGRRIEIVKRNNESSSSVVPASYVMPGVEIGASSAGFYDRIRHETEERLNMEEAKKNNLDLNK